MTFREFARAIAERVKTIGALRDISVDRPRSRMVLVREPVQEKTR